MKSKMMIGIILLTMVCSASFGCGPNQAELDAQETQVAESIYTTQTAEAPTATLIPTATSTPTPEPPPVCRIVFSKLDGKSYQIYVADENGENVRQLTFDGDNSFPAWSPDGTQIVFSSGSYDKHIINLYVMGSNGENIRQLTFNDMYDYGPDWSPNGKQITFYSDPDKLRIPKRFNAYIINADGSNLRQLSPGLNPHWSPDSSKIAFLQYSNYISIMDVDDKNLHRIVEVGFFASNPKWSPNGTQIAFSGSKDCKTGSCKKYNIFVINEDGSNLWQLTFNDNDDIFNGSPAWSSDGKKIIFMSNRDGKYKMYIMNADGSDQKLLSTLEDFINTPQWSPGCKFD